MKCQLKIILSLFSITLFFSACTEDKKFIDGDEYVVLDIVSFLGKPKKLNVREIKSIERIIKNNVANYKKEHIKGLELNKEDIDENIYVYGRQYVAYEDKNGEKIVWVNFFCNPDEYSDYWKTEIVSVDDGGNCYFQLKINLNTNKVFDVFVNGVAYNTKKAFNFNLFSIV